MSRRRVVQKPPPERLDLGDFPLTAFDGTLYRAHSRDRGAWYFASDDSGRFNLLAPSGTCYLAASIAAAVRERVGDQFTPDRAIAPEDAERMVVSALPVNVDRLADLESPAVGSYPVTSELVSMDDYEVPQIWARAFCAAGLAGVRYSGRFSYALDDSWALFGDVGADESRVTDAAPIDGFDACALAGVAVLPAPPVHPVGLTIVRP